MGRVKEFLDWIKDDPVNIKIWLLNTFSFIYGDESYIKKRYKVSFGEYPDLKNPKSFNEKLNWLKLYNHNQRLTSMADKLSVKKYVSERIGEEYIVKNYGSYQKWEEIDFSSLPEQFVIKCTHDSGGAFVCKDRKTFDFDHVKRIIEKNLKRNFYLACREWPYKGIEPRIIIDEYLDDHTGNQLRDYKFWCFNGVPKYMYCTIKGKGVYENFYDMNFCPVMIDHGFPRHEPEFEKPVQFELMKELARILSQDLPFVRVDFFQVEGKVYFGEFTFFDWGGLRPFRGDWDIRLGELLSIHTS